MKWEDHAYHDETPEELAEEATKEILDILRQTMVKKIWRQISCEKKEEVIKSCTTIISKQIKKYEINLDSMYNRRSEAMKQSERQSVDINININVSKGDDKS